VIDYNLTPLNQVRIKHLEYKVVETYFEENLEINRPYEDFWFRIIVRKKIPEKIFQRMVLADTIPSRPQNNW
jgi:hypothetical protein